MKRGRPPKQLRADDTKLKDQTDCQHDPNKPYYTTLSKNQIIKSMKAVNYSDKFYIPTRILNDLNPGKLKEMYDNRYKKPTKEEVNKYPWMKHYRFVEVHSEDRMHPFDKPT
jgi:hypothetical protein